VKLFRNLLIRRKLTLLMTLSSSLTLLVVCVIWGVSDRTNSRRNLVQELELMGDIIGQSCVAAIDFDDEEEMRDNLRLLYQHEHVRRAHLFDVEGRVLAGYDREPGGRTSAPRFEPGGAHFESGSVTVFRPIVFESQNLGTIAIESDLSGIYAREIAFAKIVLFVLVLCTLVAAAIADRLQRIVSRPITTLTATARAVSERKDYSLRATKMGEDEVGFLTEAFNEMLGELEAHRDTLEEKVDLRTSELTRKNDQLRVSMEQAKAAGIAKSQFLATMSHEIRTPMNGILGMNDLLLESSLSSQQKSYAEIVKSSTESLLDIVNEILDFSKIEAGKLTLDVVEFDPRRTIAEVVGLLSEPAKKKGLELVARIASDVPAMLLGDPTRLRQVVTNLVGNAVKFTDEGRIVVRAETLFRVGSDITLQFQVEDSGIGIARRQAKKLFEPFSQLDSSTTRRYQGTGLGLAICKQLVELMGGAIWMESEPGIGSSFWFTARLSVAEEREAEPAEQLDEVEPVTEKPDVWSRSGPRLRVLLAEDNRINQLVSRKILEKGGHHCEVAEDGLQAIQHACTGEFDVLLMDCQMPLMDGYEATRRIREWEADEGRARLHIIALTANVMKGDRERCLEAGMDDYVSKPVRPEDLLRRLGEVGHSSDAA